MNIFQKPAAFYGGDEINTTEDIFLATFRLAKRIRLCLGPKGYLLDNYLDVLFQGLNWGDPAEYSEEGTKSAYQFQRKLLSDIVDGKEPETPHPLYEQVKSIYENSGIPKYQEHRTRMYLLMALAEKGLREDAVSEFASSQEPCWIRLGDGDIVSLQEIYDKIIARVDESLMEELNRMIRQLFQSITPLAAFLNGFAYDLLYQLTYRDNENSKLIFQLLLDLLPEES